LTIAWGVFGTRITLLERELAIHEEQEARARADIDTIKGRVDTIQQRQYDNEGMIDRLYEKSDTPQPKHRKPY
jgi:hypothetical protein